MTPVTQWRRNEFESGGTGPVQKWGAPIRVPENIFWWCSSTKSTISRFGERFRDGQYSLASFLFDVLLLTVPPVSSHLQKWGTRAFRALWSRRHCPEGLSGHLTPLLMGWSNY